jgi:molecular chaperone Hsp33
VSCSGGFIIQLMPDVKDETIDALEENLKTLRTVTDMLSDGLSPEDMLNEVLKGMGVTVLDKIPVSFTCDCSKVRVTKSLIALPKADIQEMIDDNKPVEVRCQFCNKKYDFSVEELEKILEVSANKGK